MTMFWFPRRFGSRHKPLLHYTVLIVVVKVVILRNLKLQAITRQFYEQQGLANYSYDKVPILPASSSSLSSSTSATTIKNTKDAVSWYSLRRKLMYLNKCTTLILQHADEIARIYADEFNYIGSCLITNRKSNNADDIKIMNVKAIIVGSSQVGKSSLFSKFGHNEFKEQNCTIGVDFVLYQL